MTSRLFYGGDPTHNLSISGTVAVNVQSLTVTTALTSSLNPSVQGQSVTFTATIAPSYAPGSIVFTYGGSTFGPVPVSNGVASFTTSTLPPGTVYVYATFLGTGSCCGGGMSPVLTQVVKVATATSLASSPNPVTFGSVVTLTATVSPSSATGSIQFFDGGALLGQSALGSGKAQCTISNLPAGSDSLTAVYSGDAANAPSTSSGIIEAVNKINSTTTLTASPASQSSFGQTVTLTAVVTPSAATGTVQFLDGSTVIGTAAVVNGKAAFSTTSLAQENHSLKASYGGDNNVNPSSSAVLNYKVKH